MNEEYAVVGLINDRTPNLPIVRIDTDNSVTTYVDRTLYELDLYKCLRN